MGRTLGVTAFIAGFALMFSVAATPAYADPGDDGNGNPNPPGQEKKDGNGNGAGPANDDRGKSSGPAENAPAGNNGTIKIHDGEPSVHPTETDSEVSRNEPHVGCVFHLYGFHFDADQSGSWEIIGWAPDPGKGADGASGDWTATSNGDYQSDAITLDEDGHYRLNFYTYDGHAKHKMFLVAECEEEGQTEEDVQENDENKSNAGNDDQGAVGTTPEIVAGVQSPPTGLETLAGSDVAGERNAAVLAGVQSLPATSTAPEVGLGALGLAVSGLGAAILRIGRRR